MNNILYDMIFKRKSFHLFRNIGNEHITEDELKEIENEFNNFKPLVEDIEVKIKIVKDSTTCKRGQEYCILLYSEKKDNYLQNIGYIGEQLDLYLVSKNIGTLWFGIGKVEEKQLDGLDFVIMIAIAKIDDETKFRKDMYKSKRKELSEIWNGDFYLDIANIVRFTPSACNTQPWFVESSEKELKVYKADGGFNCVMSEMGETTYTFNFKTYLFDAGLGISITSAMSLIVIGLYWGFVKKKQEKVQTSRKIKIIKNKAK